MFISEILIPAVTHLAGEDCFADLDPKDEKTFTVDVAEGEELPKRVEVIASTWLLKNERGIKEFKPCVHIKVSRMASQSFTDVVLDTAKVSSQYDPEQQRELEFYEDEIKAWETMEYSFYAGAIHPGGSMYGIELKDFKGDIIWDDSDLLEPKKDGHLSEFRRRRARKLEDLLCNSIYQADISMVLIALSKHEIPLEKIIELGP